MKTFNKTLTAAFLAFGLATALGARAEIRESKTMEDLRSVVTRDTVLIFDLDNTLVEPVQSLGSDQWYDSMVKSMVANGYPEDMAIDEAIRRWSSVQAKTRMQAVEALTPFLVYHLQHQGVRIWGLTARPPKMAQTTIQQLKSAGYDLSYSAGIADGLTIPSEDHAEALSGVIFVGPKNNKGTVLGTYIKSLSSFQRPTRIVFVDDKVKHVKNVENALNGTNISYLGLRYGAADAKVKAFDHRITDIQYEYFLNIMSDETAKSLIRE